MPPKPGSCRPQANPPGLARLPAGVPLPPPFSLLLVCLLPFSPIIDPPPPSYPRCFPFFFFCPQFPRGSPRAAWMRHPGAAAVGAPRPALPLLSCKSSPPVSPETPPAMQDELSSSLLPPQQAATGLQSPQRQMIAPHSCSGGAPAAAREAGHGSGAAAGWKRPPLNLPTRVPARRLRDRPRAGDPRGDLVRRDFISLFSLSC